MSKIPVPAAKPSYAERKKQEFLRAHVKKEELIPQPEIYCRQGEIFDETEAQITFERKPPKEGVFAKYTFAGWMTVKTEVVTCDPPKPNHEFKASGNPEHPSSWEQLDLHYNEDYDPEEEEEEDDD